MEHDVYTHTTLYMYISRNIWLYGNGRLNSHWYGSEKCATTDLSNISQRIRSLHTRSGSNEREKLRSVNKQYQKTRREGLVDDLSKLQQESGRTPRKAMVYWARPRDTASAYLNGLYILLLFCTGSLLWSSHKIVRPIKTDSCKWGNHLHWKGKNCILFSLGGWGWGGRHISCFEHFFLESRLIRLPIYDQRFTFVLLPEKIVL